MMLTDKQAAKYCKMSIQSFRRLIDQGLGPRLLLDRCTQVLANGAVRILYYKAALDLWMGQR